MTTLAILVKESCQPWGLISYRRRGDAKWASGRFPDVTGRLADPDWDRKVIVVFLVYFGLAMNYQYD